MGYEKTSYDQVNYDQKRKPLMIGCSGGGGHIAAIQGIRGFFEKHYTGAIDLPQYEPVLHDQKPKSSARDQIETGVGVLHAPAIGAPIQAVVSLTSFPVLPDKRNLDKEIKALSDKEKDKKRPYIDMLLDVYPAGYESAAIWNVLQRNDKTSELKKLIDLQHISDKDNHQVVLSYYVKALKDAAEAGVPYTEIISTQAMALPALCDAVIEYNKWLDANPEIKAPKALIHQYMTDLPTEGAVHFFNALSTLSPEQQQQMKLYGVGMNKDIISHFFPTDNQFNAIYNIPARENPMVRPGFKEPNLDHSSKFHELVSITLAGEAKSYKIKSDEQIASIMLGSQASNDTIEYIETLLENGMDKVFVFGGKSPGIQEKITEILEKHPEYINRIIPLGNQGDKEIAPLMSRSNVVVIRGGGLSVMEQLAMNHSREQTVLIHHANSPKKELTSGISWEDDNVKSLIADLRQRGVHTEKTSPARAIRQIAEARLIAAVKRLSGEFDIDDATKYIKKLPEDKIKLLVTQLKESEKMATPSLPKELTVYFDQWEKLAQEHIDGLNTKLNSGQKDLAQKISEEVSKLWGKGDYKMSTIVRNFDSPDSSDFKGASPELFSAVQNYRAIATLQATLSPKSTLSANKKLENLKTEYEKPDTQKTFMSSSDNIIKRMVKEIKYHLAKYFPSLSKKFTFQQEFKKQMNDLRANETGEPSSEIPSHRGHRS